MVSGWHRYNSIRAMQHEDVRKSGQTRRGYIIHPLRHGDIGFEHSAHYMCIYKKNTTYKNSIIIAGGTINLGYQAALKIAKEHPDYLIVIASRFDKENSAQSINKSLHQDNTIFMQLDLSDSKSVRNFATKRIADSTKPQIKALVLNAGLQFRAGLVMTPEGLEATFAIAHVGHALFLFLLCPHLAPDSRVVFASSGTHDPTQNTGMPEPEYNTAEDLAHSPEFMIEIPR
ncbi:hypothetical protein BOTCAL_0812g00050 [Botryotinia calthae]|uniref:Ketoreductase (KR) domain-containing protein n=1 Tax=Botryotinia calthae TaxID=38488 RepID=A0A4Y8CFS2_9HELO|nr:hypothetical protein BOTCAL_0812g00050 [Botryotinia calthae]